MSWLTGIGDAAQGLRAWWGSQSTALINSSTQSNWIQNGILASVSDILGGTLPGDPVTHGQATASFGWGFVDSPLSIINTGINFSTHIGQGNIGSAAWDTLSLVGVHFGNQATNFGNAANTAFSNAANTVSAGAYNLAPGFLSSAGTLASQALHYNVASHAISFLGHASDAWAAATFSQPAVGGVLFDQCATLTGEISDLQGAYWDTQRGEMVLIGHPGRGSESERIALPQLDRDHLAVVLRALAAGQAIGVSIDPPAFIRSSPNGGSLLPDGTPLIVSYLGRTEGTLFGAIMFEADRLLKSLSLGKDNERRSRVRASVFGFRSLIDMTRPTDNTEPGGWTRFWFVVDRVELQHDPVSRSISFSNVRLKVLTEREKQSTASSHDAFAATAEAFARHLTDHYDDYAREFPVLARLKELGKITAVAKFFVSNGVEPDLSALFLLKPTPVATPRTTPGISVTSPHTVTTSQGSMTTTTAVSLFGGVDMDPEPVARTDQSSGARSLRTQAERARPSPNSNAWNLNSTTSSARAVSIPLVSRRPWRRISLDYLPAGADAKGPFGLRREYVSSETAGGDFGSGWSLWWPISMTVLPRNAKSSDVLLPQEALLEVGGYDGVVIHDRLANSATLYRPIGDLGGTGEQLFCRVVSTDRQPGRSSFRYDPNAQLVLRGGRFVVDHNIGQYIFDNDGRLIEIHAKGKAVETIEWDSGRIVRIAGSAGYHFSINWKEGHRPWINSIDTHSGDSIVYDYNESGRLLGCRGGNQATEVYDYDRHGRLAEVRGASGALLADTALDAAGIQLQPEKAEFQCADGSKLKRELENGRVTTVRDGTAMLAKFSYGAEGCVHAISFERGRRQHLKLSYDAHGRLIAITDFRGRTTQFGYNNGSLTTITEPSGEQLAVRQDGSGRVTGVHSGTDAQWSATYDKAGRLQEWYRGADSFARFVWTGSVLSKVSGRLGVARASARRKEISINYYTPLGTRAEAVLDRYLRPVSYRSATDQLRTTHGLSCREIQSKVGTVRHTFDEKTMKLSVSF